MPEYGVIFDSATGVLSVKQLESTHIADNAVVSGKIASGSIGSIPVANQAILSAQVGVGAVANPHLASGLDVEKLLSGGLMPGLRAGGPIQMGAFAVQTSNLLIKEGFSTSFRVRDLGDTLDRSIWISTLDFTTGVRAQAGGIDVSAENLDNSSLLMQARENAVGLQETYRNQGGVRPYMGFPYRTSGLVSGDIFSGTVGLRLISGSLGLRFWDGTQHWVGTVALTSAA